MSKTLHGMYGTQTYRAWGHMLERCKNPNHKYYKDYGGRGIQVCERWRKFENFYADMGNCPKELTLERKNNDGNYEPSNCCWATRKEQRINSRPISCGKAKQIFFYGHGPNGEMIVWNNQNEVAREFGLFQANISRCLHSKCFQHKSWTFQRI